MSGILRGLNDIWRTYFGEPGEVFPLVDPCLECPSWWDLIHVWPFWSWWLP